MNVATITNTVNNNVEGIICFDYNVGDIAYFSLNQELLDCLDILTTNPLFFSKSDKTGDGISIQKELVSEFDSYYLLAINFNLPTPWEITDIEEISGDIEEILEIKASQLMRGEKNE